MTEGRVFDDTVCEQPQGLLDIGDPAIVILAGIQIAGTGTVDARRQSDPSQILLALNLTAQLADGQRRRDRRDPRQSVQPMAGSGVEPGALSPRRGHGRGAPPRDSHRA